MSIYRTIQLFGAFGVMLLSVQLKAASSLYPPEYYKYYSDNNPLFPFNAVEVKPEPLSCVGPQLTPQLKELKKKASVVVEFVISKTGDTEFPVVLQSSDARFNDVCLAAVKQWKFKPALKKGMPVNCRVAQVLAFN